MEQTWHATSFELEKYISEEKFLILYFYLFLVANNLQLYSHEILQFNP